MPEHHAPSSAASELISLGSSGWMPDDQRETSAHLIRRGAHAVLLDAGTGVRRLVTSPDLLAGVDRLDVVLSHFHLDHIVGLGYLDALHGVEVAIWGPGQWLYGTPTRQLLGRLLAPPLLRENTTDELEVHDLTPAGAQLGPWQLQVREQRKHTAPSVAYRLGDEWVYCTDTEADPGNADFADGARVLLHEAWTAQAPAGEGHTCAADAAALAAAAGVQDLVLVHLPPQRPKEPLLQAARAVFPATRLAADNTGLRLP